jgi:hypothetical protein
MIGGLKTVLNGPFEIDTGDVLHWVWACEIPCFDKNGKRHDQITDRRSTGVTSWLTNNDNTGTADSAKRKAFYERGNGVYTNSQSDGTVVYNAKKEIAYPKSLRPARDGSYRLGDKMRVFGKALSGARAWEMVDIMISRQSM